MRTAIASAVALLALATAAPAQPGPKTAREFVERGKQWFDKKEYAKAVEDYDEAIKLDPKSAEAYLARGEALSENGHDLNALGDFTEAIKLDPKNSTAVYKRGLSKYELGFSDGAMKDYTEAIRLKPDYAAAFAARSSLHLEALAHDKALADLDEAIRLDPKNSAVVNSRGHVHSVKGEYEKAIKDFSQAIQLDPKQAAWYSNRATVLTHVGQHEKALADFNEAIRLDPKNPTFFLNRSSFRMKQGIDHAAALKDAHEAIRLEKSVWSLTHRGNIYLVMGQWVEARRDYDEAVKLDPKSAWALSCRAVLLAGCTEEKHRDAVQAVKDANRACQLTKWQDPHALDALAASVAEIGDFETAVKWQEKAVELFPRPLVARAEARLALYKANKPLRLGEQPKVD